MKPPKIMIAGGSGKSLRRVLQLAADADLHPVPAGDMQEAGILMERHAPAVALCVADGRATDKAVSWLSAIRRRDPRLPILLIARNSSESMAIAALRAGANDYLRWPFTAEELKTRCRQFLQRPSSRTVDATPPDKAKFDIDRSMVGRTPAMHAVKRYIARVARTDSTVLITGETGTGKDLVAEWIHRRSPRQSRPLVRVNCAAMPEGLVESELFGYERGAFTGAVNARHGKFAMSAGGSLFLDEIGEMRPYAQAKILHCIENKEIYPLGARTAVPFDTRVIAATNQDPESLMLEGKFREDLYYRLNVARIHLPPLRERREDIPELIASGVGRLNRKFNRKVSGPGDEVVTLLMRYDWPGNVRELMNVLEGSFINRPAGRIREADLPADFKKRLAAATQHMAADERKRILAALLETNWNKSTAAARLNWSRMTLYRKMTKYHIVENRRSSR